MAIAAIQGTYFAARGLTITGEKVFVVTNESGKHVEVETFFSFPTEGILAPFLEKFEALYVWQPGTRGMEPFPPAAMFNACLYAKLNGNMTDRELERHLLRHPDIASALGFDSGEVPSHDIISYFKRERLTEDLLGVAFNALRDHLLAIGVIDLASVSVDSAPVSAFANIGKANREVPLNDNLAQVLFKAPNYQKLAAVLVASLGYKRSTPTHVRARLTCLNLVVLYELGGFLSQAKVAKYLGKAKHADLRTAVAQDRKLPSDPTLGTFKELLRSAKGNAELAALSTFLDQFLKGVTGGQECHVDLYFPNHFGVLRGQATLVDPDARLGYCPSKNRNFLGYRVQLVIDDKKSSP